MLSMQPSTSDPSLNDRLYRLDSPESQRSIFRVHDILRKVNMKAYEPEIVAIGPYHWQKESLGMMEEHKLRYLKALIARKVEPSQISFRAEVSSLLAERVLDETNTGDNIASVQEISQDYRVRKPSLEKFRQTFIEKLWPLAEEAREKYAGSIRLNPKEFVDMLLLDGCFIIELVRKNNMRHLITDDDPIFKVDWMLTSLQRDLLLLENQVPFKVLCELFDLIESPGQHWRLAYLACSFFRNLFRGLKVNIPESFEVNEVEHLLDLVHNRWNHPLSNTINLSGSTQGTEGDQRDETRGSQLGDERADESRINRSFHSAKRIMDAGVKFKKIETPGSIFDIKFEKKKLRLRQLIFEGRTETFFRNFIAYEQYFKASKGNFVTDYVSFLGNLIDSPEDVELLCHRRVVDNKLGDSKAVADIFTNINECVTIENPEDPHSRYGPIYRELNAHCNKKTNRWRAKMWRTYCNPWGITSIIAGIVGLCLTVTMLALAVLNYKLNKKQHK